MNVRPVTVSCAVLALAAAAGAQLDGSPLTADWYYPSFGGSIETHDLVVGPDIELKPEDIVNDDSFSIDIGDDTVTFLFHDESNWTETGFNGWHFADNADAIPEIASYSIFDYTPGLNVDTIVIGSDANAFWADFSGLESPDDGFLTLKVTFVPAPAAGAPLALAALGLRRRR